LEVGGERGGGGTEFARRWVLGPNGGDAKSPKKGPKKWNRFEKDCSVCAGKKGKREKKKRAPCKRNVGFVSGPWTNQGGGVQKKNPSGEVRRQNQSVGAALKKNGKGRGKTDGMQNFWTTRFNRLISREHQGRGRREKKRSKEKKNLGVPMHLKFREAERV